MKRWLARRLFPVVDRWLLWWHPVTRCNAMKSRVWCWLLVEADYWGLAPAGAEEAQR